MPPAAAAEPSFFFFFAAANASAVGSRLTMRRRGAVPPLLAEEEEEEEKDEEELTTREAESCSTHASSALKPAPMPVLPRSFGIKPKYKTLHRRPTCRRVVAGFRGLAAEPPGGGGPGRGPPTQSAAETHLNPIMIQLMFRICVYCATAHMAAAVGRAMCSPSAKRRFYVYIAICKLLYTVQVCFDGSCFPAWSLVRGACHKDDRSRRLLPEVPPRGALKQSAARIWRPLTLFNL